MFVNDNLCHLFAYTITSIAAVQLIKYNIIYTVKNNF